MKNLRDWLKTNPQLQALFEAGISTEVEVEPNEIDENTLNAAASVMNMNGCVPAAAVATTSPAKPKIENLKIVQFANAQRESYADLVCQV